MEAKDKINHLSTEISEISKQNYEIGRLAEYAVSQLPDYFFYFPASSTGKHHAKFSTSYRGLLKHTKAAFYVAQQLFVDAALSPFASPRERALALLAIILHDGCKMGLENLPEQHTRFEHPLLMVEFIENRKGEFMKYLSSYEFATLEDLVSSHMGPFTTDSHSDDSPILPFPDTEQRKFIHLCDYIASRKYIEFSFRDETEIGRQEEQ